LSPEGRAEGGTSGIGLYLEGRPKKMLSRGRSTPVLEHKNTEAPKGPEERNDAQRAGATSRRGFLSGLAKVLGGGALAMALGGGTALAQERTAEPEAADRRRRRRSDVKILNYALVLERLEYAFYVRVLNRFGERQFENAGVFDGLGEYLRTNAHENFVRIRDHEKTHVETLVSVIKSLGGKPLPESEYDFGITSVASAVSTARVLENTGVSAYDGAIAYIRRPALQTAGATIATVEARHASYLNLINKEVPFLGAFDEPKAPRAVCKLVADAFITKSPYNLKRFCESLPNEVIAP
jgi:rubrerythrin